MQDDLARDNMMHRGQRQEEKEGPSSDQRTQRWLSEQGAVKEAKLERSRREPSMTSMDSPCSFEPCPPRT